MQNDLAVFIAENAGDFNVDVRLYSNYSGRGMMGETTTGLVVPSPMVFATLLLQMNEAIHEAVESGEIGLYVIQTLRSDNLGHDTIIY